VRKIIIAAASLALFSCGTLAPAQTQYFTGSNGVPQGRAETYNGLTTVYDSTGFAVQTQNEYRSPSEGMWDYNASKNLQQQYITTPQNMRQERGTRERDWR